MKALRKGLAVLLMIAVVLTAVFLAGRYGWKLGGFRACQGAGITSVEVGEKSVHITGFYPGPDPISGLILFPRTPALTMIWMC